jgi:hypothetical protein
MKMLEETSHPHDLPRSLYTHSLFARSTVDLPLPSIVSRLWVVSANHRTRAERVPFRTRQNPRTRLGRLGSRQ